MKQYASLPALCTLVASMMASAQNTSIDPAVISALHAAAPAPTWDGAISAVADVTCDGSADTLVVGHEPNAVWLGVVQSPNAKKTRKPIVVSFSTGGGNQGAFCAQPVRIELYPLTCDSEYGKLPGCKPIKHCVAFSLNDDECDPLNFYWDSIHHKLRWWRD